MNETIDNKIINIKIITIKNKLQNDIKKIITIQIIITI